MRRFLNTLLSTLLLVTAAVLASMPAPGALADVQPSQVTQTAPGTGAKIIDTFVSSCAVGMIWTEPTPSNRDPDNIKITIKLKISGSGGWDAPGPVGEIGGEGWIEIEMTLGQLMELIQRLDMMLQSFIDIADALGWFDLPPDVLEYIRDLQRLIKFLKPYLVPTGLPMLPLQASPNDQYPLLDALADGFVNRLCEFSPE